MNVLGIYLVGPYAWDDGAITLAYARTLAERGVFALTQFSEVVEGTSSLLFVGVMALLHKILGFGFEGFILASQVVALLFLCLTLILVSKSLKEHFPALGHRLVLVSLFGTLPMFTAEVLNGMEMTLMAFLMSSFLVSFRGRKGWFVLLVPLLLLIRFEAVFYLLVSLTLFWWFNKDDRKQAFVIAAYALTWFLLISGFRLIYFEDYLPNTIWAKMHAPYSVRGNLYQELAGKLLGMQEFFGAGGFLVLLAAVSLLARDGARDRMDLGFFLLISFAVFAVITGRNWGYQGRMFLACFPIAVLMMEGPLSDRYFFFRDFRVNWGNLRDALSRRSVVFATMILCLAAAHWANRELFVSNLQTILNGGHKQRLLPKYLDDAAQRHLLTNNKSSAWWEDVTPHNYRITGLAVEKIRVLLGLATLGFMVPDIGGLGLCCDKIRVIDSALLTNSFLAKMGYRDFNSYIAQVKPDVIETHGLWSKFSRIYQSSYFRAKYLPVVFENNLLWIRIEHLGTLLMSENVDKRQISKATDLGSVRYAGLEIDQDYLQSHDFGTLWHVTAR